MKARRGLLLAGSLWELVRFFLVLLLFAAVLVRDAAGAGPWIFPWLVLAGSGNLLVAVGVGMLALFPARYARLVPLLRLGKVLGIFSFVLLAVSGALRPAAALEVLGVGRRSVSGAAVLFAVAIVDVLLLAVLVRWKGTEEARPAAARAPEEKLPEYDETEVEHFH